MTEYVSAFLIGLVSAGHCLGMCGGLMLATGLNSQAFSLSLGYNLGRITTYTILGLLLGFSSSILPEHTLPYLQFLSATLLILTALHLIGVTQLLRHFERIGLPLWRFIQPLSKKLLPVKQLPTAYALGLAWGFIPCGLVYTALTFSLTSGNAATSALRMACFGLGTLPVMLSIGLISTSLKSWLYKRLVQYIMASLLVFSAVFIFFSALKTIG
ncbi:MAG: sulfite exporter TauE/SafE family protein [Reinekea sp.]